VTLAFCFPSTDLQESVQETVPVGSGSFMAKPATFVVRVAVPPKIGWIGEALGVVIVGVKLAIVKVTATPALEVTAL